ncbi:MAG: hypothetical protein J6S85_10855 [Methanobrevibacter sp.]|nr:hypothetical protein [Methanobrevibacter sp.]
MKNLTRNGVAKNLEKSPYVFTEVIDGKLLSLHFSSKLHLRNFMEKRNDNFVMLYNHIYKRFKYKVNCKLLSELNLYQKIENRGYYIKFNNEDFQCQSKIILSGVSRMSKNSEEWQETLMINYAD